MSTMVKINNVVVAKSSKENIFVTEKLVPDGNFMRYLRQLGAVSEDGFTNAIITVDANGASGDDAVDPLYWDDVFNATKPVIKVNGNLHTPFLAGSSMIRKAQSMWTRNDLWNKIHEWFRCGLDPKRMELAENKLLAYMGLLVSSSTTMMDTFGDTIDPERVAVVSDISYDVTDIVDKVSKSGNVTRCTATWSSNITDGLALLLKPVSKGEAFTLRAPWTKALCVPCDVMAFAKTRNVDNPTVTDVFGNVRDVKNLDAILFESAFKMVGVYKSQFGKEGWNEYCKAFRKYGHTYSVCVREHATKVGDMGYQPLQTLIAADSSDIRALCDDTVDGMKSYRTIAGAARLLGGEFGKAAMLYPELLTERYSMATLKKTYASRRNKLAGGRVPNAGRNLFIAPDLIAVMEGLLGLPINGALKRGEVCVPSMGASKLDLVRYPHLDNAHCVRRNVRRATRFLKGNTAYLSIDDSLCVQVQADFDGDHMLVIDNPIIVNLAERTVEKLGNVPLMYEADKAAKKVLTSADVFHAIHAVTSGAPIGLFANALTKIWAFADFVAQPYLADAIAVLTRDANTKIDAAKHSTGGQSDDNTDSAAEWKKTPFPRFLAYAKSPEDPEAWANAQRCGVEISDGVCDTWCTTVLDTVPTADTYKVDADLGAFDWRMLVKPENIHMKNIIGFVSNAKADKDEGFFNKLAFRKAHEWRALKEQEGSDSVKLATFDRGFREDAIREIEKFLAAYNQEHLKDDGFVPLTFEDAADYVVRAVFFVQRSKMQEQLYRFCWNVFGEVIVKHLADNLHAEGEVFENLEDLDIFDDLQEVEM